MEQNEKKSGIREKLYYFFVKRNWFVEQEYTDYLNNHTEADRLKRLLVLARLNLHYRILRSTARIYPKPAESAQEPETNEYQLQQREIFDSVLSLIRKRDSLSASRDDYNHLRVINYTDLPDRKTFDARYLKTIQKYSIEEMEQLLRPKIIVSFTTYPPRIESVHNTIETILTQTVKPDEIILWLAFSDFPNKMEDLPQSILDLVNRKELTIRWCDDLKPHKKYFFAMLQRPDDILITIDDDLYYDDQLVERLFVSYLEYPRAVSASRCHLIRFKSNGDFLPYQEWGQNQTVVLNQPTMQLFPTNGAGSLFPPRIFDRKLLDSSLIRNLCLFADDLWLKTMELLSDVPTVAVTKPSQLSYVEGTQNVGLWHENVSEHGNDIQLRKIKEWVDENYGPNYLERKIKSSELNAVFDVYDLYEVKRSANIINNRQIRQKDQEISEIVSFYENSISYRVGLFLTFLPRKLGSFVKKR